MSESARDLLVRGVAAAKAGDKDEARFYLEKMLRLDPTPDQRADAWVWLSAVYDDLAKKRDCIENALSYNPDHPVARRGHRQDGCCDAGRDAESRHRDAGQ